MNRPMGGGNRVQQSYFTHWLSCLAQASLVFQLTSTAAMGVGLISLYLHLMEWLLLLSESRPIGSLSLRLSSWALYFGVLNQKSADTATAHLVSCA